MKLFYGIMCVLGTILPYSQFLSWIAENGFRINLLLSEIMNSKIGAFAWLDVIVSAIVLLGFIIFEGKRSGIKHLWAPVLATVTVGVSLGLPLFLLLREISIQGSQSMDR